jgi:hypothetical protein
MHVHAPNPAGVVLYSAVLGCARMAGNLERGDRSRCFQPIQVSKRLGQVNSIAVQGVRTIEPLLKYLAPFFDKVHWPSLDITSPEGGPRNVTTFSSLPST